MARTAPAAALTVLLLAGLASAVWVRNNDFDYLAKVKVYPGESIMSHNNMSGLTPILIDITYRRRLFEVLLDFVLVAVAYYGAYLLRFEGNIGPNFDFFLRSPCEYQHTYRSPCFR